MSLFSTLSKSVLGLALVAASTSGHALSISTLLHLHSHIQTVAGPRAMLTLKNPNVEFRDVKIAGQIYSIPSHHAVIVTAPVGTPVYAASRMFRTHAKGSVIAQVESGNQTVSVD